MPADPAVIAGSLAAPPFDWRLPRTFRVKFGGNVMSRESRTMVAENWSVLLVVAILFPVIGCQKQEKPSVRVFASPDQAGDALVQAGKSGNQPAVLAILGPDAKDLISSRDAVSDKANTDRFMTAYGEMHRWRRLADGAQTLVVGTDNHPFAIPLKKNAAGKWYFDTAAGRDEVLSRRIGRNELAVIDTCLAVADSQFEYFSQRHSDGITKQFAAKFISDPGKQNGLYWVPQPGQPRSPLGPFAAFATTEGYKVKPDAHTPFHGYYFQMLNGQGSHAPGGAKDYLVNGKMSGGFAFVAYPAEYGNSGVMTFLINQDGVLLQKDLGKTTSDIADAMTVFDPDVGWVPVQQ
jgi:hypothetical protein